MRHGMFAGFSPNDGSVDFYTRIGSFLRPELAVLDLGAGRAAWYQDDTNPSRRQLRLLKGRVARVVAADVDPAVRSNPTADESVVLPQGAPLPFPDASFDLVIADFVLEHVDDPPSFAHEVSRILRKGGLFAARTPHKYCYVALAARLVSNARHGKVLSRAQPRRKVEDIFPTRYRLNTLRAVRNFFPDFDDRSFIFRTEPAYHFGNRVLFEIQDFLHRVCPAFFSGNLFVFLVKR